MSLHLECCLHMFLCFCIGLFLVIQVRLVFAVLCLCVRFPRIVVDVCACVGCLIISLNICLILETKLVVREYLTAPKWIWLIEFCIVNLYAVFFSESSSALFYCYVITWLLSITFVYDCHNNHIFLWLLINWCYECIDCCYYYNNPMKWLLYIATIYDNVEIKIR